MPRKRLDLTGKRFGRLTVLAPAEDKRLPSGEASSPWRRRDEAPSESAQRVHEQSADPFTDLANAIVACAADDYRTALKEGDKRSLASLERFFHSRWYALLTGLDPDRLISRLKAEA